MKRVCIKETLKNSFFHAKRKMHKSFQNFKYKKKTIFKKSENCDQEKDIILIA